MNSLLNRETETYLEKIDADVAQLCENLGISYTAAPTETLDGGSVRLTSEELSFDAIENGLRAAIAATDPADRAIADDFNAPPEIVKAIRKINTAFWSTIPTAHGLSGNAAMPKSPTVADVVKYLDQFETAIRQRSDEFQEQYDRRVIADAKYQDLESDLSAVRRVFGFLAKIEE